MNIYKAHNKRKTLVHHCNKINKSIQIIMDCLWCLWRLVENMSKLKSNDPQLCSYWSAPVLNTLELSNWNNDDRGWLKVRVVVTPKRLVQQDSVESLQSDRELLEKELSILVIGRQKWFCCPDHLRTAQLIRWLGQEFPKQSAWIYYVTLTTQRTWLVFWMLPSQLWSDPQMRIHMPMCRSLPVW